MILSEDQIKRIRQDIDRSSINLPELKEDLVDHFCCVIEVYMKKGVPFQEAYEKAYRQICPNGLDEIQQETIFLLNSQRTLLMKKIMYFIGFISSVSLSLGIAFKILGWFGANQLFIGGTFGFAFLFIPLLAVNHYKAAINRILSEKVMLIMGYSSAILFGTSVFFKIIHLQYANMLLLLSVLVLEFGFLPFLFIKLYKRSIG